MDRHIEKLWQLVYPYHQSNISCSLEEVLRGARAGRKLHLHKEKNKWKEEKKDEKEQMRKRTEKNKTN
jgi:hypothetical protein